MLPPPHFFPLYMPYHILSKTSTLVSSGHISSAQKPESLGDHMTLVLSLVLFVFRSSCFFVLKIKCNALSMEVCVCVSLCCWWKGFCCTNMLMLHLTFFFAIMCAFYKLWLPWLTCAKQTVKMLTLLPCLWMLHSVFFFTQI